MEFVFSPWYFVMIALVVGIAVSVFFFIKMDKKDKVLIENFVKEAQTTTETEVDDNKQVSETGNKTE